jgi:hypothetical protein
VPDFLASFDVSQRESALNRSIYRASALCFSAALLAILAAQEKEIVQMKAWFEKHGK